jgi:hypothetical protein
LQRDGALANYGEKVNWRYLEAALSLGVERLIQLKIGAFSCAKQALREKAEFMGRGPHCP